ncbi:uncharacterized protein BDZ99DRAFT_300275 [Mytilinidion resinicola]|uniref:Uncharacterized protein n=1 Tax=Mytilinidion resinicola TaxID=574789 RepID=A0A6A6YPK6_9PEZI|nr:uncharacterized protein BDZ99DRAFT_300275 [Mytilinidion resinicola]KAF2809954.1 hypothetical protein BDZ99DRAFT_300275 [Mytilinidion resinicola]
MDGDDLRRLQILRPDLQLQDGRFEQSEDAQLGVGVYSAPTRHAQQLTAARQGGRLRGFGGAAVACVLASSCAMIVAFARSGVACSLISDGCR